jgi:hypothetical protein
LREEPYLNALTGLQVWATCRSRLYVKKSAGRDSLHLLSLSTKLGAYEACSRKEVEFSNDVGAVGGFFMPKIVETKEDAR